MGFRNIIIILIISCGFFEAISQVDPLLFDKISVQLKDNELIALNKGREKMQQESYLEAIPFFEKVLASKNDLNELYYVAGICYSYDANNTFKALQYIKRVSDQANAIEGFYFNLAYAYEKNDSIAQAIENYKIELALEEKNVRPDRNFLNEINYRINRCNKIAEYKTKQNEVRILNIGRPVNSNASEYCPLITSNENVMIFTYRGPKSKGGQQKVKQMNSEGVENLELFFEDIFLSRKLNDSLWSEPKPIDNLNTGLHDAAVCLSTDGSQLFVYRNLGKGKGDLYLSKLVYNTYSKPVYQGGLNSAEWDGAACFIPNTNKIIFASERKGGFGGKDLYVAEKLKENVWGNIKNLGPDINSKYDEDAPFVTADGKILFFSSNNNGSLGGYDIFRSDFNNANWQKPYNLGAPINTKYDDKFFNVRADGKVGYYSSFKQGGKGEQDIYRIEPGIPGKPVELLQVDGYVSVDGKPAAATIEINSVSRNKKFYVVKANKSNGQFLSNLPAGDKYEITVRADGFPPQVIELNTVKIDSFMVLNVFAEFMSPEYDRKLSDLVQAVAAKELHDAPVDLEEFGRKYGDFKKDSLAFKVQIGAYKFFENFNYNNILGFPKIIRQTGNDYITRFIMGHYSTFNEAQQLLNRIKQANILTDAFIFAVYKEERKYIKQLLNEKIID